MRIFGTQSIFSFVKNTKENNIMLPFAFTPIDRQLSWYSRKRKTITVMIMDENGQTAKGLFKQASETGM